MKVSRYWWCFFFGYMFARAHSMFMQDLWGLNKYIEVVKLHWVDIHWSIGFGIMVVAAVLASHEIHKAKCDNWEKFDD